MADMPTIPHLRICVLPPLACLLTCFRLYVRYSHRTLWWDDLTAFFSSVLALVFVATFLLHIRDAAANPMSQNARVSVYYLLTEVFYGVTWTARTSMLFTVIRLCSGYLRKVLFYVTIGFFFVWVLLSAQLFWVCEGHSEWKSTPLAQCDLSREVAITLIITDVLCDAILVAAPVGLLWQTISERSLKFRLIAVFASTSIATAVSVSLFVANLTVVTALVMRLFTSETEIEHATDNRTTIAFKRRVRVTTFGGIETVPMPQEPPMVVQLDFPQMDHLAVGSTARKSTSLGDDGSESCEVIELRVLSPLYTLFEGLLSL
ncbi:hypothetical protein FB45DRAFT_868776 [Roridomyces roridus]|uniref:Rhodopsin domain-containing protein n=1 Tax=Roridomyces roridus TaxID=1738132 RepID=A0AAD7BMI7_9AGAR|nr:hypothetical protein FB45DRAFT_868776 [Roridomyces roridus]